MCCLLHILWHCDACCRFLGYYKLRTLFTHLCAKKKHARKSHAKEDAMRCLKHSPIGRGYMCSSDTGHNSADTLNGASAGIGCALKDQQQCLGGALRQ